MYEIKPELFALSNGIRVVYLHTPSQVAHLGITVLAGSRFERKAEDGLAHFLEHCIFKGTTKRKAFHILSRLDSVGGELNAYTAKEEMCVYASFTKEHIRRASELLADITLNSNFPLKEIQKEKEIILDEINSYLDSPSDKIFDDFEEHLFKGHALGNNILGTKERVQGFTRSDLQEYVKRFFTTENMVISFVGEIGRNRLEKILEEDFNNCLPGKHKEIAEKFELNKRFKIRTKEANYQVHAIVGGIAPNYKEESRRGMTLLTNILGGPALNSRLTLSIREKYGYSYNVEANYTPYVDTGFWSVYLGTDPKYIDKSIALIYKELKLLRTKKLGVLQLNRAKEQLKGHLALGMDSNSGLMLGLGKSLLLFNQIDTIPEIYQGIDKLEASELLEIANQYFSEENCNELIFDLADS
jgi:predicted Zn-dependent peptidase